MTFALGVLLLARTEPASAASNAEDMAAVQKGHAYLYRTQKPGGYWGSQGYEQAATGAAAFAFLSQHEKWGNNNGLYQTVVQNGLCYLRSTATLVDLGTRTDGRNVCPGGSGSCKGVYWSSKGELTYTTGFVAPAIAVYGLITGDDVVAATKGPLAG